MSLALRMLVRCRCGPALLLCAAGCRNEVHERWVARDGLERTVRQQPPVPERPARALVRLIQPRELCISRGFSEAGSRPLPWLNTQPKVRATVVDSAGAHAALSFRYLGPTPSEQPLRSGQFRRQIGLKLFAEDTCNLLYVMWRFDRPSSVVVSVKRNLHQHQHAECTNRGYRNLQPSWSAPVAAPAPDSVHELAARVQNSRLDVTIDGKQVLHTDLSGVALPTRGLSGLRSDNVAFELVRFAADMSAQPPGRASRCRRMEAEGSD